MFRIRLLQRSHVLKLMLWVFFSLAVSAPALARTKEDVLDARTRLVYVKPSDQSRVAQAKQPPPRGDEQSPAIAAEDPRLKNPPPSSKGEQPADGRPARVGEEQMSLTYKTPYEVWLTLLTVALAIVIIGLFCYVNRRDVADVNFSRHFIILSVIFSALFLIVAGYTEKQTAPVFGLLGTIIGYLFGITSSQRAQREPGDSPPKS